MYQHYTIDRFLTVSNIVHLYLNFSTFVPFKSPYLCRLIGKVCLRSLVGETPGQTDRSVETIIQRTTRHLAMINHYYLENNRRRCIVFQSSCFSKFLQNSRWEHRRDKSSGIYKPRLQIDCVKWQSGTEGRKRGGDTHGVALNRVGPYGVSEVGGFRVPWNPAGATNRWSSDKLTPDRVVDRRGWPRDATQLDATR